LVLDIFLLRGVSLEVRESKGTLYFNPFSQSSNLIWILSFGIPRGGGFVLVLRKARFLDSNFGVKSRFGLVDCRKVLGPAVWRYRVDI
jgi:hypothetical protein